MTAMAIEDKYYVIICVTDTHRVCMGPFDSSNSAWTHEYADNVLDARRSDSRSGVAVRKDGKHTRITKGVWLNEDLYAASIGMSDGLTYELVDVTEPVYPNFWEKG